MTIEETHRHDLGSPTAYGWAYDDDDPFARYTVPATIYTGSCEALEPYNDPSITVIDVTVPDGATWVTCPNCREHIRVGE